MVQLINVSSADCDICNLPGGTPQGVESLLQRYGLDGIEFMVCDAKDTGLFPRRIVRGIHLWFYPSWMHFWRGNEELLARDYAPEQVRCIFGDSREEWLTRFRDNFRVAGACGAEYAVFHVAHAGQGEIFARNFFYDDRDVVEGTIEVACELVSALPQDCMLLYENLWWPGLTFQKPQLAAELLARVSYPDTGFMLDTGHLMNTNLDLQSEAEGAAYVQKIYHELGELGKRVYGIHLHQSLSGAYTREMMRRHVGWKTPLDWQTAMDYVMHVDQHQPFHTDAARRIVETVQPMYLVNEFQHRSRDDLVSKLHIQQRATAHDR